ncbi:MAG: hypothetical protein QX198_16640 [Methylococcaceae bacterium]
MTAKELTIQAFKLYETIKFQSYKASEGTNTSMRLHFIGVRAFYRYKRRLKAE